MKILFRFLLAITCCFALTAEACDKPASVCLQSTEGSFPLIVRGKPVPVIVEKSADPAVLRVAESFADDLKRVSGKKPRLYKSPVKIKKSSVLIGVLGQSAFIDELVESGKLNTDGLSGQWEAYQISVVKNPWPKVDELLVVVGSDRRGAIYGAYDISEKIGVSPWYWFADAPVKQHSDVYITAGNRSDQPKVRYRGIFINDEDPSLSTWARIHFGGVNADMYEPVFELILRSKGNYIWPAMWGKAFNVDDPENTALADSMGIVVGTSHHEPMTRAHKEWHLSPDDPTLGGAWNYVTNRENLQKFWRGGIERMMSKGDNKGYESLVTLGMRGDGDEPMSEGTAINLLETIVTDQREIISDVTGKPAEETPQVWALYKEVQEYYDKGMTVPDDVTLLFADDNWGQVRRLPIDNVNRKGGYGVYYHFDYVGAPRNYKWTNTVQIEKVWQQMNLAYESGARNIWIANVGDLKPMEYPIDFFLEMAWNPDQMDTEALAEFPHRWAEQLFGEELAADIADLVTRYGKHSSARKPELLDETTYAIGKGSDPVLNRGAFKDHFDKWQSLQADMEQVKPKIKPEQYSAFYQLVEYPIASLANLYDMYFSAAWNHRLASHYDQRANYFRERVENAYALDTTLTNKYHAINDSKWDGMMNQVHMNYVTWHDPTQQSMPPVMHIYGGKNNIDVEFGAKPELENGGSIEASAYSKAVDGAGVKWTEVPNLGQSNAAMIVLPQGQPSTTIADGVHLEYNLKTTKPSDTMKVSLALSPTIDTQNKNGIRLGVSLDNGDVKVLRMNLVPDGGVVTPEDKKAWSDAVINNCHMLEVEFSDIAKGDHTLKVWRLDDNVILEKIDWKLI